MLLLLYDDNIMYIIAQKTNDMLVVDSDVELNCGQNKRKNNKKQNKNKKKRKYNNNNGNDNDNDNDDNYIGSTSDNNDDNYIVLMIVIY